MIAEDAWQDFTSRLRSWVHRRIDPAFADDVLGDILLRLVRHRDALRAAENPSAWVFAVAANVLTDHHRRRSAEQRALARAELEPDVGPAATQDESDAAAAGLAACMHPLLRDLPAPYGEALLLTEVEGLSQSAAAKRLGLSLSGMKSRVQRGRTKLKDALLRCCSVELDRGGRVLAYAPQADGCGSCGPREPLDDRMHDRAEVADVRRLGRRERRSRAHPRSTRRRRAGFGPVRQRAPRTRPAAARAPSAPRCRSAPARSA